MRRPELSSQWVPPLVEPVVEPGDAERARLREELLSSISHELRTPLSSVIGYTEVVLSGDAGELSEEQQMMLNRVAVNGERLLHLIEGLLDAAAVRHEQSDGGAVDVIDVIDPVCRELDRVKDASSGPAVPRRLGPA
jgi:signal transduction histidine kinase